MAIDGRRITLSCGAKPPGFPTPTYRWWKEGSDTTIASGSEFTIGKGSNGKQSAVDYYYFLKQPCKQIGLPCLIIMPKL